LRSVLRQSSAFFPVVLRYSALSTGPKVKTIAVFARIELPGNGQSSTPLIPPLKRRAAQMHRVPTRGARRWRALFELRA
ncbi:hypothetical protein, partial [Niveibacterium sp.]|uniref:hypothetical protein n=1 Tax=Niveibacterium sp. TaxID=2017444 RepID=UPI0035AFA101